MATIKDGIKIGFGLLLFKWLLGAGGCIAVLGAGTCLYGATKSDGCQEMIKEQRKLEEENQAYQTNNVGTITFTKGCILRAAPSTLSDKIGFATAGATFDISDTQMQWRQITVRGKTGWVGCRAD